LSQRTARAAAAHTGQVGSVSKVSPTTHSWDERNRAMIGAFFMAWAVKTHEARSRAISSGPFSWLGGHRRRGSRSRAFSSACSWSGRRPSRVVIRWREVGPRAAPLDLV